MDQRINTTQGYTINATVFKGCPGFQYSHFADLLGYHVLLDMHAQNYTGAESEFTTLNGEWDGHGFVDEPFNQTRLYQSYKLAVYMIVWDALQEACATQPFAESYLSTVNNITKAMSRLQSDGSLGGWAGGVWTGSYFANGQLTYGNIPGKNVSLENGETTSAFVLASGMSTSSAASSLCTTTTSTTPEFQNQALVATFVASLILAISLTRFEKKRTARKANR
jgi:hypothetical protein